MDTFGLLPAIVCYALSAVLFLFGRMANQSRATSWATGLLGAGVALHAIELAGSGIEAGNIPVANFPAALSLLAWLTALLGFVLIVRMQMAVIGAYAAATVASASALSAILTRGGRIVLPATLQSVWLPIHVGLAILGYSLFVLAASVSLVYLAYESKLKSKRPLNPDAPRMPSLEKLDRVNYALLGWGFAMLSLAIVSGAIWADATWGHFWSWEPVESWSLIVWILYAALLESRLTVGWRGRRAAALTIALFMILLTSFVGVSLMYPGKHGGTFG